MKKGKEKTKFQKFDKYMYKNSYLYKWGKLILKSRAGRIVTLIILFWIGINTGTGIYQRYEVRTFLKNWEKHQNSGDYDSFMENIDSSQKNVYRISFPDWKELLFKEPVTLRLKDISVKKTGDGIFQVKLFVNFMEKEEIVNRFKGVIFLKKEKKLKIFRVEL